MDELVAWSRPAWWWVGQVAVVLLGVHLAADRLDDGISWALVESGIPWPEPDQPLTLGTWFALLLELYVGGWAVVAWVRANAEPLNTPREWFERGTPHSVAAPLVWGSVSLAGAWMIGMATEDFLAPYWATGGQVAGWLTALLVAWRLGWPGLVRVVRLTPVPIHRWDGALTVWPAVFVGGLALRYGLPVWGWIGGWLS